MVPSPASSTLFFYGIRGGGASFRKIRHSPDGTLQFVTAQHLNNLERSCPGSPTVE